MADFIDEDAIAEKSSHLRANFVEAIEQLDHSRVERRDEEKSNLLNKITKMVWFQDIGSDTNAVLQDIRAALDEEQHATRTTQDRLFSKLRASVDHFSDGMTKQVQGMRRHVLEQKKDALSMNRSAASKETEIELGKQKHEFDTKFGEMKRSLEDQLKELQDRFDEMMLKKDGEIQRVKNGLRDKTAQFDKLTVEHERLKAKFELNFGEADAMRVKCEEQEQLIGKLRLEVSQLAMLRDHFEELEAQMGAHISPL
eukprot:SAG11_NODE_1834_length_4188_cov_3.990218_3_plen_255_part_00